MTRVRAFATGAWRKRPSVIWGDVATAWRRVRTDLDDARTEIRMTRVLLNAFGSPTPTPTDTVEQRARAGR